MSIRSFIRLNFKEDCFSIIKRVKLNNSTLNWFYFLTKKEAIENTLDAYSGGCEKRYLVSVCGNLDGCYSNYPTKVIALFSKAMQQSKISIDYPRSLILKMLRKKERLSCPKDDYKISSLEIADDKLLDTSYELIDCECIEVVSVLFTNCLIIDDSGKLKEKKVNPICSMLYAGWVVGDYIVGDALLGKRVNDEIVGLDESELKQMLGYLEYLKSEVKELEKH